jgi:hypothetical protein
MSSQDEKYKELMAKLEKVKEFKSNLLLSEKELWAIMKKGADTFQKETGKTYGEMYG